jgi:DUF4097 and DUF4098 domain-containing protein YvlB
MRDDIAMIRLLVLLLLFALALPPRAGAGTNPPGSPDVGGRGHAAIAGGQSRRDADEASETVKKTFALGADGSFDLTNFAGDVVVTGGSGREVLVQAIKRVRAKGDDARADLDLIRIEASETPGRVEIRTVFGKSKGMHASVDYTVTVPAGTAVALRTLAGDVRVINVSGDVQIETANGDIVAQGTPRLVRVKTLAGDIEVDDAGSPGALSASTVSGDVVARRVKARSMELVTVSGSLRLEEATCERAEMRTVNGDLYFRGPLAHGGRYEFNTHAGDVSLSLPSTIGFELNARTFSGEVSSELPLKYIKEPGEDSWPEGVPRKKDVKATFGDGSALLLIKTFSGDVRVAGNDGDARERKRRK